MLSVVLYSLLGLLVGWFSYEILFLLYMVALLCSLFVIIIKPRDLV